MFTLSKQFRFEAAHKLPLYDGNCQRLHGHSFIGRLIVRGENLYTLGPKSGMLVDYKDLSEAIKPLLQSKLDHHYLNETTGLANPTSEELARWIYWQLEDKLPKLVAVELNETCTSSCLYVPEHITYL